MLVKDKQPTALQIALERARDPALVSLALGMPAADLFPCESVRAAAASVFRDGASALQYGVPEMRLKEHITQMMHVRGVDCTEDEVFLTTGAQQALGLLAQMLLTRERNAILVENAVYPGFIQAVEPLSPHLTCVPPDATAGIDIEALVRMLHNGEVPAFLYTMSTGHNPLGSTMTGKRRAELTECAAHYGFPIVEDDAYGFLQYDTVPAPSLRSLSPDLVFYVGSLSKILAPAFRVGWIISPKACTRTLSALKEGCDLDTATLAQRIACRYLDSNNLLDHVLKLRNEYRKRRDVLHEALSRHLGTIAYWERPSAGFFFWVKSEAFGDTGDLLSAALANGVAFVPGTAFSPKPSRDHEHSIRLSLSQQPSDLIAEGIAKIALTVRQCNTTPLPHAV